MLSKDWYRHFTGYQGEVGELGCDCYGDAAGEADRLGDLCKAKAPLP